MRDSTEMEIDPLSDVLRLMKAEPTVTGGFTAGGPWAIRFPARDKIKFFGVVRGECWAQFDDGGAAVKFETGDVGLLAEQRSFVLSSAPDVPPVDAVTLFSGAGRTTAVIGDGSEFEHFGGHVLFDPAQASLVRSVLPAWVHIRAKSPEAVAFRALFSQLVIERAGAGPGRQLASTQLTQLLFIHVLRAHLKSGGPMATGWLRALADARIAPALRLMHRSPDRPWSLEELARACGMSRTTFASHFREIAGVPPLTYLTEWRMRLAEQALRETATPMASIAQRLGYASESAFSNAFKRVTGRSPRTCRRSDQVPASSSLYHSAAEVGLGWT
jgi:AraC-like DNA-binding protein